MTIGWNAQTGITGLQTQDEKLLDWQTQLQSGVYAIHPNFKITTPNGTSELTPEQAIFGLLSANIVAIESTLAILFAQLSPSTAEGVGLDALFSLLNLERKKATPTTSKVQVVGSPLTILNNQLVLHESTQQLFQFAPQFTIPNTGAAQTILTSIESIPIQISAGDSAWSPVNPPNTAISSITSLEDSVTGNPQETSEAFRLRKDRELGALSIATEDAILATVSRVSGVTSLNGEFNRSPVLSPSGVPGWHIELVVEGGNDLDIANAIDLYRHGEAATFGNIAITASSGRLVYFSRPTLVDVEVQYTIKNGGADVFLDKDTRSAIEAEILEKTINRINLEQGVGDDVSPSSLTDIVLDTMPPQSINQITILAAKLGDPLTPALIGISKRERARALAQNIDVSITD